MAIPLSGLCVILDAVRVPQKPLKDILTQCADAGARIFQYRNKVGTMKECYEEALSLRKIAASLGAVFIVNDRCDLAMAVDADGVHLGQTDLPYAHARKVMGLHKLIGLSTHNPEQARQADRLKPDYIGVGPLFTPGSKPDHDPVIGIEGLRAIRSITKLPIFAIGGITREHLEGVMRAGADGVAVASAILRAPDIRRVVSDFAGRMPPRVLPDS